MRALVTQLTCGIDQPAAARPIMQESESSEAPEAPKEVEVVHCEGACARARVETI